MTKHLPLALILLVAAVLRFADLGNIRMGIHPDEAMYGYDGLSILRTGTDHRQTGHPPLFLRGQSSHWDNRTSTLYPYLLAGLFTVLPVNTGTERLPAAAASFAIVFLVYLVARKLFPSRRSMALVAAALLTLSPTAYFWGRLGHDLIFMPFFALLIIWTILCTRHDRRWWFGVAVAGGLGLYAYQPLKLVGPLVAILTCWYIWPSPRRQISTCLSAVGLGAVLASPLIATQLTHWSEVQGEFSSLSLLHWPVPWRTMAHQVADIFGTAYLLSFKMYLPLVLPLSALTMGMLWKRQRRVVLFGLGWVAVAILPALITSSNAIGDLQWRSLAILGVFEIFSAWAIVAFHDLLRRSRSLRVVGAGTIGFFISVVITVVIAMTWVQVADGQPFCCMNYGGFQRLLAVVQRPELRDRPVVIQLTSYDIPDRVLWLTVYPPDDFQRGPVTWQEYAYPKLGRGERPVAFGRYTFCQQDGCTNLPNKAMLIAPATTVAKGSVLYSTDIIAPQWETSRPWTWNVIDTTAL